MLASSRCTDCSTHAFLPNVPSPLSPRSANIYGRRPLHMSSDAVMREERKSAPTSRFAPPPPQRAVVKKAPVVRQDELKERRRGMFMRKVREGREEKRWESRGEDMMRLDFMQRQRQWEAEQAREAPPLPAETIDEEEDDIDDTNDLPSWDNAMQVSAPPSQQQQSMPDDELDEVLQRENEELEALLSYMPGEQQENVANNDKRSDHMWSDDDDYDALFSEFVQQSDGATQQSHLEAVQAHDAHYEEAMDLS
ncbi:hypothetical protein LTR36_008156 [Oleoguttula mirabilis]|uniref:Uncharacterized protein n=1 Tax=Oleoguttula mirabilis TaxID=1507867 RepID=A0AAV9J8W3_9PEZI|nr:hypothetical protein LTR36_008156 [Oleoguttula mirabilis]